MSAAPRAPRTWPVRLLAAFGFACAAVIVAGIIWAFVTDPAPDAHPFPPPARGPTDLLLWQCTPRLPPPRATPA